MARKTLAPVIELFPKQTLHKDVELSPKGSAWLIFHRLWRGGGSRASWSFVFNQDKGLTAFEAWQLAKLYSSPPFYECVTVQLAPFPNPLATKLSVNTKGEK